MTLYYIDYGLSDLDIAKLLPLILKENEKQIKKWGKQIHDIHKWLTIIHEEIGEIDKAILEFEHNYYADNPDTSTLRFEQVKKELIQTITLYIKLYKMMVEQ